MTVALPFGGLLDSSGTVAACAAAATLVWKNGLPHLLYSNCIGACA